MKIFSITVLSFLYGSSVWAQVGINTATPNQSSILDINSNDRGLLIPHINLQSTQDQKTITNGNVKSLLVYNSNSNIGEGYYYWDGQQWQKLLVKKDAENALTANSGLTIDGNALKLGGTLSAKTKITTSNQNTLAIEGLNTSHVQSDTDYLVGMSNTNELKALKAAMPKFFYMPSIAIPTHKDQVTANETFGTIDLYEKYKAQFQTPACKNTNTTTSLPALAKSDLDYYISWYDREVFNAVTVNDAGILTYSVKTNAEVTMASFMNIIFAVKP